VSSIRVPILPITELRQHSNPEVERLEIATVAGWQLCVPKGRYTQGNRVVYFERGTALPRELADALGVTNYLSEKTDMHGEKRLVVSQIRLKGEPSFGLAIEVPDAFSSAPDETDLADYFGAVKYEPPIKVSVGDALPEHPLFPKYTDIENMRSYPHVFHEGEQVVATEKIHGTNVRVGAVVEDGKVLTMAGSRQLRRAEPGGMDYLRNPYWFPLSIKGVQELLSTALAHGAKQVIVFGETFGSRIQSYDYGMNALGFRAFDIMIDGEWLNPDVFATLCETNGVATVPVIYRGPFSIDAIRDVSNGKSLVGGTHGREGVVVRPIMERFNPTIGRTILKYVGDDYLFGKANKNDTTDV
jgi:RNA ligase (TIGR02306 family)